MRLLNNCCGVVMGRLVVLCAVFLVVLLVVCNVVDAKRARNSDDIAPRPEWQRRRRKNSGAFTNNFIINNLTLFFTVITIKLQLFLSLALLIYNYFNQSVEYYL